MSRIALTSDLEIPRELEIALGRILVHLQKNEHGACHDIVSGLEAESKVRGRADREAMNCIASLPGLDLRLINFLESAGFIYVSDLDGVDLYSLKLPYVGMASKRIMYRVVEDARRRLREEEGRKSLGAIALTQGSE